MFSDKNMFMCLYISLLKKCDAEVTTRFCNIPNSKAIGLVVSDTIFFSIFPNYKHMYNIRPLGLYHFSHRAIH